MERIETGQRYRAVARYRHRARYRQQGGRERDVEAEAGERETRERCI